MAEMSKTIPQSIFLSLFELFELIISASLISIIFYRFVDWNNGNFFPSYNDLNFFADVFVFILALFYILFRIIYHLNEKNSIKESRG